MKLLFLGTGAGVPAKNRNVSALALKLLDERNEVWLFDCGEATQHAILHTTLKPRKITKIFITHLHGDHLFGLPGLLSSRSFQGGDDSLTIYGPKGIAEWVTTSLRVSQTHLKYPLLFSEIVAESGVAFADDQFTVRYQRLNHGVPCYGYRVIEADQPGELQAARLQADGIPPGPLYKRIKNQERITLPDGRVIDGSQYVGQPIKGRQVVILGDTRRSKDFLSFVAGADVLVHEATFGQAEGKLAYAYYHSTSTQAAQVAKDAGVGQLYLTHISARYLGKAALQLEREAQTVFAASRIVFDLDEFEVLPLRRGDEEEKQHDNK